MSPEKINDFKMNEIIGTGNSSDITAQSVARTFYLEFQECQFRKAIFRWAGVATALGEARLYFSRDMLCVDLDAVRY